MLTINVLQNDFLIVLRKWKNRTIFYVVKPDNVSSFICSTIFVKTWI